MIKIIEYNLKPFPKTPVKRGFYATLAFTLILRPILQILKTSSGNDLLSPALLLVKAPRILR